MALEISKRCNFFIFKRLYIKSDFHGQISIRIGIFVRVLLFESIEIKTYSSQFSLKFN